MDNLRKLADDAHKAFKAFLDAAEGVCDNRLEDFENIVAQVLDAHESELKHRAALPGMIRDAAKAIREHDEKKEDILVSRALQRVFMLGCELYDDYQRTFAMRTIIDWMDYDDPAKDWTADVKCVMATTPVAKVALYALVDEMKTPDDQDLFATFVKRLEAAYTRLQGIKVSLLST